MDALIRIYSTGEIKTIDKSTSEFISCYCGDLSLIHDIIDNFNSNFVDKSIAPKIRSIECKFIVTTDNPTTFSIPYSHIKELSKYIIKNDHNTDKP